MVIEATAYHQMRCAMLLKPLSNPIKQRSHVGKVYLVRDSSSDASQAYEV
jgi:hypothetical protein